MILGASTRAFLGAAVVLSCGVGPVAGQTAWTFSIGENADAATGVSSGTTGALSLTRALENAGFLIAAGAPLEAGGIRWGTAAGWFDQADLLGGLGALGSARTFGYHDSVLGRSGGALTGDLQAYHPFDAGPVSLRVRGGARAGLLGGDGLSVRRILGRGGADATLAAGALLLRAEADFWAAAEAVYPEVAGAGVAVLGPVVVRGRISRVLHEAVPDAGWMAEAELFLSDRLSLVAGAARPSTDLLFFSPPQRSWSVGARYGGGARPRDLPVPVVAAPHEVIRVTVPAEAGMAEVRIAGTFNDWDPEPMRLVRGRWVAELRLPTGIYEYAFVAPDGSFFVPEGTPGRKADGFGGYIATIVVR